MYVFLIGNKQVGIVNAQTKLQIVTVPPNTGHLVLFDELTTTMRVYFVYGISQSFSMVFLFIHIRNPFKH